MKLQAIALLVGVMVTNWRSGCTTLFVRIDTVRPLHRVEPFFLSVTLDSYLMEDDVRWGTFNFSSTKMRTLLEGLSPAVVRVGGTPADFVFFDTQRDIIKGTKIRPRPVTMTKQDWDNLVDLTKSTGCMLLFDLNLQRRFGRQWDPSDAIKLLQHSAAKGYEKNIHFELGNEPGLFAASPETYGEIKVSGTQLGEDFLILKDILKKFPNFNNSRLVGPDILVNGTILTDFLKIVKGQIDAATLHHYYFEGPSATYRDYIDFTHFDNFSGIVDLARSFIAKSSAPNTPLWIGETSDAWDSGTKNVSDRFVSGFLWLDKLGVAASKNIGVVMRQTFYGHHYGLLNSHLDPNPDYWLSFLHKKLVGRTVLDVHHFGTPDKVRLYAHCTETRSGMYKPGAVTFFAINVNPWSPAEFIFSDELGELAKHVYLLQPGRPGDLLSREVRLNGKLLQMPRDTELPRLKPIVMPVGAIITFPPLTFGYVVFPEAAVWHCKET